MGLPPTPAEPFPLLALQNDLLRDEGEKLVPYKDTLDNWTIGVGHLIGGPRALAAWCRMVGQANGLITPQFSRVLLGMDIHEAVYQMDRLWSGWRQLTSIRQRALVNMMFNLGPVTMREFVHTLKAIQDGRYADAARGMVTSRWGRQVGDRDNRLAYMMEHDSDDFPQTIA